MAAPLPPPAAPPMAAPAPAPIKPGARNAFVMSSPIQPEIGKHNAIGLGSRGEPRVSRTRDVAVLRLHRRSSVPGRANPPARWSRAVRQVWVFRLHNEALRLIGTPVKLHGPDL